MRRQTRVHLYRLVQRLSQYWRWRENGLDFIYERGTRGKTLRALQSFYNGPLRFLVPLPVLPRWNTPTDAIFTKQAKDPQYEPTAEEQEILKKYGAYQAFRERKEFTASRPTWTHFRRWVRIAAVAALTANSALAMNFGLHLSEPRALMSAQEFLAEPAHRLQPHQVRIYNETVPFPHMAIEIEGTVYSYGQTHLRVSSEREYLQSEDIHQALAKKEAAKHGPQEPTLLQKGLSWTGADKLNRSVQMITLNLTQEQRDQLKRDLELSTAKAYRNNTFAMDCSTMIVLALKKIHGISIPEIIDASPSLVMMYLAALKSLGATNGESVPLVANIQQISNDNVQTPALHLFRNLYINVMEAKIYTLLFPYNAAIRGFMEARYGKDNYQYWNPEVRAEIEAWQRDVDQQITSSELGEQLKVFRDEAESLRSAPDQERLSRFNQVVEYVLGRERDLDRQRLSAADTSFEDLIRAAYRLEALDALQRKLTRTAAGYAPHPDLRPSARDILEQFLQTNKVHSLNEESSEVVP